MKHVLRYNKPASDWNEALPIGNAFLGSMVYGNPCDNHFQLNEESIWSGGVMARNNPDSLKYLKKVRELILNDKIKEAENIMSSAFVGTPNSPRMYQTAGDLFIENEDLIDYDVNSTVPLYDDYERILDLDNSYAEYSYRIGTCKYKVTSFVSNPSKVMVVKFESEGTGKLNLKAHLERGSFYDKSGKIDKSSIFISGRLGSDEYEFYEGVSVKSDGNDQAVGDYLYVRNATFAVFYIAISTSFKIADPEDAVGDIIYDAKIAGFNRLFERHVADYKRLYNRTDLSLFGDDSKSSEELLSDVNENIKEITEILFSYGKYLLISSSRDGSLPATLQGIWNKDFTPPWGSKYTLNINTEMNYWPSEMCNLAECHLPLFGLMERMRENGKVTAKTMYGCKGWVSHHNTDIWGDTAPVDNWIPGTFWVMGGAWLCTHIWKHYEYTEDIKFLRDNYHLMRECAEFFMDFLCEKDGYLVTIPSVSPENSFIYGNDMIGSNGIGCAMDNQILIDLFTDVVKACEVLDIDVFFRIKAERVLCKLKPIEIGTDGQILEWDGEYKEVEPGHRHMSHLYALYPSDQITVDKNPELAKAAEKSLKMRLEYGGGHTGWSRAWIINLYAKLWDKDETLNNLILFAKNSLLPNFLDNHPPFQIDGNFGVCAGISEMFVQSDSDRIVLLPALPDVFSDGEIRGIKCVGNVLVNITWEGRELLSFSMLAVKDKIINVMYKNIVKEVSLKAGDLKEADKTLFAISEEQRFTI